MNQDDLARQFEQNRRHLRAVAYRMLGSLSEAEDAVQEAWLRLSRSDSSEIANLGGWLTTVVSRVCLDMLRARKSRREDPYDTYVPDPVVSRLDPEEEAVQTDSVGLAMLVVLETLKPAERLAFVLHDLFGVSFDEIAPIVDKTPAATRQLASRARRRVQGAPTSDGNLGRQREVVEAFLAASRSGDFDGLLAVLDPDVVLRADAGAVPATGLATSRLVRGAKTVVEQALLFGRLSPHAQVATVNGAPGLVTVVDGRLLGVMSPEIRDGRIVEINILADLSRLESLPLPA
ncbi:RNA polymerase, sigma-24 subunit, ECF subfamily [Kribbella flavida DSM 17836]|uniref:RNA polymerase, sigma-24 subunit, ECF subfamily n=1 Tax=Kribbella flavida (strain DSM 17836 / JCM 10339 / NBRC 14399) TaxID=479435 RepID=D2PT50_KRIFD|nr:RNA polymerase sigma factor SigJ [Kribbella flavida]ADB29366.1 RNA polymerase, sigma-24 subunit, ECF subfamily [Kribbella flavida DSM 17836]